MPVDPLVGSTASSPSDSGLAPDKPDERLQRVLQSLAGNDAAIDLVAQLVDLHVGHECGALRRR